MAFEDNFKGDTAALLGSIEALLNLAAVNALVPPVPAMPLQLLQSAAARLSTPAEESSVEAPERTHDLTFRNNRVTGDFHIYTREAAPAAGSASPSDITWLRGLKENGHCGEGTLERRLREERNDRIDRLLAQIPAPAEARSAEAPWRTFDTLPDVGRKFVALYSDGSGAAMFFRCDGGYIDAEGDDHGRLNFGHYDRWTYLPDLEFACENYAEDPVTLRLPTPPKAEADHG